MAEQLADNEKAIAPGRSHAGEGMPEIMQAITGGSVQIVVDTGIRRT